MPPGRADLLLDQGIIIKEPLGGGGHSPAALHRVSDNLVRLPQHILIGAKTREQAIRWIPTRGAVHIMPSSQRLGVIFKLADAEQLRPERLFILDCKRS